MGADLQTTQTNFQRRLLEKIRPEQVGLVFQPVKADGLAAATGSTDFSSLFIGFSLFLIVSAALLVGLLFRLSVEQRSERNRHLVGCGISHFDHPPAFYEGGRINRWDWRFDRAWEGVFFTHGC